MTAATPASGATPLSDRLAAMAFDSMSPSLTALIGERITNSTSNLGSLVLKQFEAHGFASLANETPMMANISKMISDHYESRVGSVGQALAEMHRTQFENMFQKAEFQNAMLGFSRAFAESVGSADVGSLLAQAASLQGIVKEEQPDVDEFAAEFMEDQPVLRESIKKMPLLTNLSSSDRQLVVWFFGVVMALYVTWGIMIASVDSPELAIVLSALGVSGTTSR